MLTQHANTTICFLSDHKYYFCETALSGITIIISVRHWHRHTILTERNGKNCLCCELRFLFVYCNVANILTFTGKSVNHIEYKKDLGRKDLAWILLTFNIVHMDCFLIQYNAAFKKKK